MGNTVDLAMAQKTILKSMLLEVQCEVSTVSDDLGCHVICWCWSTVFSEVHSQHSRLSGNFRALNACFCWQALWRCWFHFPAGPAHIAKGTKSWFNDHGVTVLDWPANSPDLNPIENLRGIVKRKMRDTRPNNADDLKAAIKATWASLHLSSATGWSPPCHAALMQSFMQKEPQQSIEWIEMNILFRSLTFLFKISFFYWSYVRFKFSETLDFWFTAYPWVCKCSHSMASGTLERCCLHGWIPVFTVKGRWQTACMASRGWAICWCKRCGSSGPWWRWGYGMGRCMLWTTSTGAFYWWHFECTEIPWRDTKAHCFAIHPRPSPHVAAW